MRHPLLVGLGCLFALGAGANFAACGGDDNAASKGGAPDGSVSETSTGSDTGAPGNDANAPGMPDTAPETDGGPATDAGCAGWGDAAVDDAGVSAGSALVQAYHCARCHQMAGTGGVVLSGNSMSVLDGGMVYAPNLTPDRATGLGCWTETQITNAILNGVDNVGATLCVMPKFSTKGLDAGGAADLAILLHSLSAVSNNVPNSICPGDSGTD